MNLSLNLVLYIQLSVWGPAQLPKTTFSVLTIELTRDDSWASTSMRAFLLDTKNFLTFLCELDRAAVESYLFFLLDRLQDVM